MDWTTFDGHPFHYDRSDVDLRRELIQSLKATAAFFAALVIGAIVIATQLSHGPTSAVLEPMSVPVCLD
jgi:hypothetical protein